MLPLHPRRGDFEIDDNAERMATDSNRYCVGQYRLLSGLDTPLQSNHTPRNYGQSDLRAHRLSSNPNRNGKWYRRRKMKTALVIASIVVLAWGVLGCSARYWGGEATENPGVRITSPTFLAPAELQVTSDTQASVKRLVYGKGTFELEDAKFGQQVVGAMEAQAAKLGAVAELQLSQARYVAALSDGIRSIVAEIIPVLKLLSLGQFVDIPSGGISLTLPGGSFSAGTNAESLAERIAAAAEAAQAIDEAVNVPATQPVD